MNYIQLILFNYHQHIFYYQKMENTYPSLLPDRVVYYTDKTLFENTLPREDFDFITYDLN